MPRGNRNNAADAPVELAGKLIDALTRERVVPRFVDGYVEEHQRYGLQVHAALYRDLIGLLQREALIAMTVRAFEVTVDPPPAPRGKPKPYCLPKKDVPVFRRKFLTALTRQQKWGIGEALDFQRDLQMYESLIARNANSRRRKAFEVSNHPFVDRCAFLLDSSFIEKARMAASRALTEVENLSAKVTADVLQGPQE
ncbi:MAG TPA: hypothetical protein VGG58_04110 [Candidatus Acidoferrum sp.]|jgi:hypothetical protein